MAGADRIAVKVCCIADAGELALAAAAGATAVGLVSAMPSGPGVIDDARIARLNAQARRDYPALRAFVLTSRTSVAALVEQQQALGATTLQLCAALPPGTLPQLRAALPAGVRLVQVIHVQDGGAVDEAVTAAPWVDELLLDSGRPALAVPELGGTGRRHDWQVSRAIRAAVDVPVWLAGGLDPGNVAEAIATVRPHGVDVCSGLRPAGRLDGARLAAFVAAAATALRA